MELIRSVFVIVFLFSFEYLKAQDILDYDAMPDKCHFPEHLMGLTCCVFPPFFRADIAKNCGAIMAITYVSSKPNITSLQRKAITGCDYWKCLLNTYKLLDGENVDDERYFAHLDKWIDANPEFSGIMFNAKIHCKQIYRFFMPIGVCSFHEINACIRHFINTDCPRLIDNAKCRELKDFYEECREFYL